MNVTAYDGRGNVQLGSDCNEETGVDAIEPEELPSTKDQFRDISRVVCWPVSMSCAFIAVWIYLKSVWYISIGDPALFGALTTQLLLWWSIAAGWAIGWLISLRVAKFIVNRIRHQKTRA